MPYRPFKTTEKTENLKFCLLCLKFKDANHFLIIWIILTVINLATVKPENEDGNFSALIFKITKLSLIINLDQNSDF